MRGNFRVWDNKNKRYDYGDFFITTDGELLKDVGSYSVEVWRCEYNEPGRYIAEFYTGLKDVNGDEICEGDIVAFEDSDGGYEYPDVVVNTGIVEYGELGFYFTNRVAAEMDDFYIKDGRWDDVEIIGSIHENHELLGNS